jgi:hypothetical protein
MFCLNEYTEKILDKILNCLQLSKFQLHIFFKLNRLLGTSQNKIRIFCYHTTQSDVIKFFLHQIGSLVSE